MLSLILSIATNVHMQETDPSSSEICRSEGEENEESQQQPKAPMWYRIGHYAVLTYLCRSSKRW
jgi:hypothetical protein